MQARESKRECLKTQSKVNLNTAEKITETYCQPLRKNIKTSPTKDKKKTHKKTHQHKHTLKSEENNAKFDVFTNISKRNTNKQKRQENRKSYKKCNFLQQK